MEFQRGNTVREGLKIGVEANAYILWGLHIMTRTPILHDSPGHNPKYKGFSTDLVDEALIKFLEMLDDKGLNIEFHEELLVLMRKAFLKSGNIPRLYDLNGMEIVNVTFVYQESEEDAYRQNDIIPRFFGKYVKYKEKYYEIKDDTNLPGEFDCDEI